MKMQQIAVPCPECGETLAIDSHSRQTGPGQFELSIDMHFLEETMRLHFERQHPDAPDKIEVQIVTEIEEHADDDGRGG